MDLIEFSPNHLRGAGTHPERFSKRLGDLGIDVFEISGDWCIQALSSFEDYTKRIGSRYTVLLTQTATGSADSHATSEG